MSPGEDMLGGAWSRCWEGNRGASCDTRCPPYKDTHCTASLALGASGVFQGQSWPGSGAQ